MGHPAAPSPRVALSSVGFAVGGSWLLRNVSLTIDAGEVVGVVGANGAGKSTLLRLLSGYLRPTVGTVLLEGKPVARYRARERARLVATVPQLTHIEGERRAEDIVLLGRYPHLGRFAIEGEKDRAIARLAMRSTDTDWLADRPVSTLSGGERQRLLIARALAQEPRLLLLDEPTASLDLRQEIQILDLVRQLADDGLTVVAAIHDLRLAARYADRLVVLRRGEVIADAPPREALTPEVLADAFGVRPLIEPDPLTGVAETVLRPIRAPIPRRSRVHVIAGGGRGAPVLARLAAAGFELSVGPLGEGDTDLPAARLCGARVLTHRPFAPIDDRLDAEHRRWVREADAVILADVCWGYANLPNLLAAEEARRLLAIEGEPIARRDFTQGRATAIFCRLAARLVSLDALVPALLEECP
ncbi:MAG: ATP-binding cassette domain-containing protein [Chloroflexota bacterium]|nr:ATP-binding cassette domain-containing protein [Dehalococcoidia bacterium]MDW8255030.1 ATP-binding cassette domain-containing protein [Chloroflexota bacterium]